MTAAAPPNNEVRQIPCIPLERGSELFLDGRASVNGGSYELTVAYSSCVGPLPFPGSLLGVPGPLLLKTRFSMTPRYAP